MALFIYPSDQRQELGIDLLHAAAAKAKTIGTNPSIMRHVVRALLNHDLLLVPSSVERIKQVAHLCGINVRPVSQSNHPAPAPAARQTQQSAGAGNL
jgi:hypothetical protein